MSQSLIEKQGKYYKEVEVVMLKADKAENSLHKVDGSLIYHKGYFTQEYLKSIDVTTHHLYFLSDEEIKEGDWVYNPYRKDICKYVDKNIGDSVLCDYKKIIATTDSSLMNTKCHSCHGRGYEIHGVGINCKHCKGSGMEMNSSPSIYQPSPEFIQAFIEAYNSGKPITKVLVEYNQICHKCHNLREDKTCCSPVKEYHKNNHEYVMKLKDNQIIVKKIEEKVYSESEVIELLNKAWIQGAREYQQMYKYGEVTITVDNWIKQNLK